MVNRGNSCQEERSIVRIVDDDLAVREALTDLLASAGFVATSFSSPAELLDSDDLSDGGCIVLDVRLAGTSGLDFQRQLRDNNVLRPVIVMTGYGDIPMTVRAMKAGAVNFLTKPFRDQEFLDAVSEALKRDQEAQLKWGNVDTFFQKYNSLTPREKQVAAEIVNGQMNKQVAAKLGISQVTVKLHRRNLMRKLEIRTLAELVKKMEQLKAISTDNVSHPS